MEKFDVTSFENAINSLNEVIDVYNADISNKITRDSLIQRFEYTYSLALKMMTRFINLKSNEAIPVMTFNETIRTANRFGLLNSNLEIWDDYRQKRNMTSHTYDEDTAIKVVAIIENFKNDAEFLLNKLKEKILND
ncbi:nucleotidyltransferase substrate binding protein [bacterium]|nr:nucleotidyltransferase substrate binding protein [bacterium]